MKAEFHPFEQDDTPTATSNAIKERGRNETRSCTPVLG